MTADQVFVDALRTALNHLYDLEVLRQSPLITLFRLDAGGPAVVKLQQTLLDAVAAQRPLPSEPAASIKRRTYSILQLRYEQQFSQQEVAAQLGLSVRQYRRMQQAALQTLAYSLWEKFEIGQQTAPPHVSTEEPQLELVSAAPIALPESLRWVDSLAPSDVSDLAAVLPDILELVQPLAHRRGCVLRLRGDLSFLAAIHPLVLRQVLLHLLNTAIVRSPGADVTLDVQASLLHITLTVQATLAAGMPADPAGADFDMVRSLATACGATLTETLEQPGWSATLVGLRAEPRPVLVIDDHPDTIDLLKRYLVGTRYRLVSTTEPRRGLDLALESQPYVILLDVMMPDADGWEVLTRLKQHEATADIPVWVCTVLDQSELALSLGASGFLRKPVMRQALLTVLESCSAPPAQAPR